MPTVDDELTRRFQQTERTVDGDGIFEQLARRRSHQERVRRVQAGALAFVVLATTAGAFFVLREAFGEDVRDVGESPVVARNGEIVFSAEGTDGYVHLYAMKSDGSGRRQITDFGTNDTDPAVSPDGRTIAFVHQLEDARPAIATIPFEGGIVTWLTDPVFDGSDPAWSPDGSAIAFVVDSTRLYVSSSTGQNARPIVRDLDFEIADPSWSPDGSSILFGTRAFTGASGLASVRPDGTGLTPMEAPGGAYAPAWSPDGSTVAFMRPDPQGVAIWTMDGDAASPHRIAIGAFEGDLTWAPDGASLLASDGAWILRIDPSGSTPVDPRVGRGTMPAWQPLPETGTPLPTPTPFPSPSRSSDLAVVEIGLEFRLCNASRLGGIDWFGDGRQGIAWIGTRMTPQGRCSERMSGSVVAADLHGDGIADTWSPIDVCLHCEVWATTDLDANGAQELVVLLQGGTTPQYGFFVGVPAVSKRASGIYPLSIAPPGSADSGFPADGLMTIWAGGDEGESYAIRCEGAPDEERVLVVASLHQPVDTGTSEIHVTRLELRTSPDLASAAFHVLDTASPAESSEDFGGDAKACGVDFNPWA